MHTLAVHLHGVVSDGLHPVPPVERVKCRDTEPVHHDAEQDQEVHRGHQGPQEVGFSLVG